MIKKYVLLITLCAFHLYAMKEDDAVTPLTAAPPLSPDSSCTVLHEWVDLSESHAVIPSWMNDKNALLIRTCLTCPDKTVGSTQFGCYNFSKSKSESEKYTVLERNAIVPLILKPSEDGRGKMISRYSLTTEETISAYPPYHAIPQDKSTTPYHWLWVKRGQLMYTRGRHDVPVSLRKLVDGATLFAYSQLSSDGNRMYVATVHLPKKVGRDATCMIFRLQQSPWDSYTTLSKKIATIKAEKPSIFSTISWDRSGEHLALGTNNGKILIWNRLKKEITHTLSGLGLIHLAWHPEKNLIASGETINSSRARLCLYDLALLATASKKKKTSYLEEGVASDFDGSKKIIT